MGLALLPWGLALAARHAPPSPPRFLNTLGTEPGGCRRAAAIRRLLSATRDAALSGVPRNVLRHRAQRDVRPGRPRGELARSATDPARRTSATGVPASREGRRRRGPAARPTRRSSTRSACRRTSRRRSVPSVTRKRSSRGPARSFTSVRANGSRTSTSYGRPEPGPSTRRRNRWSRAPVFSAPRARSAWPAWFVTPRTSRRRETHRPTIVLVSGATAGSTGRHRAPAQAGCGSTRDRWRRKRESR
jgi:hypothetical protein